MEPHSRHFPFQNGTFRFPQALIFLLRSCLAGPSDHIIITQAYTDTFPLQNIRALFHRLFILVNPFSVQEDRLTSVVVGMVKLTVLCGIGSSLWIWSRRNRKGKIASPDGFKHTQDVVDDDAAFADPGLLKKHSTLREYAVPSTGFTYSGIRTFYRPHPQEQKLPQKPAPIPLLVFIHGLGGSAAQFHPILISLSNLSSCLAIDLPGCGLSSFNPTSWEAYTTEALVQLLAVIIETYRNRDEEQSVVLIGHSMGCSLATMLASTSSPYAHLLSQHVSGLIAICPKAEPPSLKQSKALKKITAVPGLIFDLYRKWDRRGGLNSASVTRMTGAGADDETKRLQLRFNKQSCTAVWRRMAHGMCPDYSSGFPKGGLPGQEIWAGLQGPVFLAAGESDHVTPVENVRRIVKFLGRDVTAIEPPSEKASLPIAAAPFDPATVDPNLEKRKHQDSGVDANDLPKIDDNTISRSSTPSSPHDKGSVHTQAISSTGESAAVTDADKDVNEIITPSAPTLFLRRLVVKTVIMPKPAAHSLLFAPTSSRIISGLIGNFFADHIDPRLSLAWQLQYLSTEGKWDVKNLEKWKAVQPVSKPIAGVFRALKTLREVDEKHSPKIFVKEWAGKFNAVVDISHDAPVYDPKGLEQGGITYYKFPTVSKQPPTREEVRDFIDLIDKIRAQSEGGKDVLIGIHCHYGFNRTGFFVVSYLVEKLKYKVEDAIETFQKARPPGIRHDHFINELHMRYFSGLKKAPTL